MIECGPGEDTPGVKVASRGGGNGKRLSLEREAPPVFPQSMKFESNLDCIEADKGRSNSENMTPKTELWPRGKRLARTFQKELSDSGFKQLMHTLANEYLYDIRILRLKNEGLPPFANENMMDKVLDALSKCKTVQVLYIQNFVNGMKDRQLEKLTEVLKLGYIWGLNIGESTNVSREAWRKFAEDLRETNVTHMYASEGTLLTAKEKIDMMDAIRENRKKHKRYFDLRNRNVIDRVSNMWFNPRASGKYQAQFFGSRLCDKVYDRRIFTAGTVCWARIKGKLFWPSIVCSLKDVSEEIANQSRTGTILVRFLSDPDVEQNHAYVSGNMIQPWIFQRVSEKLFMRRPAYRRAVIQAMLLYFARKKQRAKYEPWLSRLVEAANDRTLERCCVVDSLLPGGDGKLRVGHLVWHENYPARILHPADAPEIAKHVNGGARRLFIQYFGQQKQISFVKPEAVKPLCEYRPPEKLLMRNSRIRYSISDVSDYITSTLNAILPKNATHEINGLYLYRARLLAVKNGVEFDGSKNQTIPTSIAKYSIGYVIFSRDLLEGPMPNAEGISPCLDPTTSGIVNVASAAVNNCHMNDLMQRCGQPMWEPALWDEALEICGFLGAVEELDGVLVICAAGSPFRFFYTCNYSTMLIDQCELEQILDNKQKKQYKMLDKCEAHKLIRAKIDSPLVLVNSQELLRISKSLQECSKLVKEIERAIQIGAKVRRISVFNNFAEQHPDFADLAIHQVKKEEMEELSTAKSEPAMDMRFSKLWRGLKRLGWKVVNGDALSESHFYLKPNTTKSTGIPGVTLFKGESELYDYCVKDDALIAKVQEMANHAWKKKAKTLEDSKSEESKKVVSSVVDGIVESIGLGKQSRTTSKISMAPKRKRFTPTHVNSKRRRTNNSFHSNPRKSYRALLTKTKLCARPACQEVVTGTYCTVLCQKKHKKEEGMVKKNTVQMRKDPTTDKDTAKLSERSFRKKRSNSQPKLCANPGCPETVTGTYCTVLCQQKHRSANIEKGSSNLKMCAPETKDKSRANPSSMKKQLIAKRSDPKILVTGASRKIGKTLKSKARLHKKKKALKAKRAKQYSLKVKYNTQDLQPKARFPQNIILHQKPDSSKNDHVRKTTARTRNFVSQKKICARPGCSETVTGTYCTDLCRRTHLEMIVPKIKTERGTIEKHLCCRDNVNTATKPLVHLLGILSYCLRTVYLASKLQSRKIPSNHARKGFETISQVE